MKRILLLCLALLILAAPFPSFTVAETGFTGVVTYRSGKNVYLQNGKKGFLVHLHSDNDAGKAEAVKRGKVVTVAGYEMQYQQGGYSIPEIVDAMIVEVADSGASASTVSASLSQLNNDLMAVKVRVEAAQGELVAAQLQLSEETLNQYAPDRVLVVTGVLSANSSGRIILGARIQPRDPDPTAAPTPAPTEAPTPAPTEAPTDTLAPEATPRSPAENPSGPSGPGEEAGDGEPDDPEGGSDAGEPGEQTDPSDPGDGTGQTEPAASSGPGRTGDPDDGSEIPCPAGSEDTTSPEPAEDGAATPDVTASARPVVSPTAEGEARSTPAPGQAETGDTFTEAPSTPPAKQDGGTEDSGSDPDPTSVPVSTATPELTPKGTPVPTPKATTAATAEETVPPTPVGTPLPETTPSPDPMVPAEKFPLPVVSSGPTPEISPLWVQQEAEGARTSPPATYLIQEPDPTPSPSPAPERDRRDTVVGLLFLCGMGTMGLGILFALFLAVRRGRPSRSRRHPGRGAKER